MSRLVTLEEVRKRIGFPDHEPANDAIEAAIEDCAPALAALFRLVDFDAYEDRADIFYVDESDWEGPVDLGRPWVRLRLAQGFLDGAPSEVRAASRIADLSVSGSYTDLQDVDGAGDNRTLVDAERGYVTIESELRQQYVRVVYSGGFEVGDDGVYEDTPRWLKTAAYHQVVALLKTNIAIRTENNQVDFATAERALMRLVDEHARQLSNARFPI